MDAQMFKDEVFDYSNGSDWKFDKDTPIIIDFYADWCGPCKMVSPILEQLSDEYAGKVQIYKVDTEAERELSAIFGIRSIPSFLFIPTGGKTPMMQAGALPKSSFEEIINNELLTKEEIA